MSTGLRTPGHLHSSPSAKTSRETNRAGFGNYPEPASCGMAFLVRGAEQVDHDYADDDKGDTNDRRNTEMLPERNHRYSSLCARHQLFSLRMAASFRFLLTFRQMCPLTLCQCSSYATAITRFQRGNGACAGGGDTDER